MPTPAKARSLSNRLGAALDNFALMVSPKWGAARLGMRRMWEHAEERYARMAYEAAEDTETRAGKWLGSRLSPDSELELDLETARERSRQIYKNDSMGGAIDSRVNHVVGTGFTPQAKVRAVPGLITTSQADRINADSESLYEQWSLRADRSRRESLWQLSRLVERHIAVDGESFTVMSDEGDAETPIPLCLEVIDPIRVEVPPEKAGDANVRMGIEYDSKGRIVAYWIRKTHPHDTKNWNNKYDRVPANRVLHVFEKWFAGQSRGLPWMCRVLNRVQDGKDLDEAAIIKAQVQACFAVFVKGGAADPYTKASTASTGSKAGKRLQEVIPGGIHYLHGDEDVQFSNPASTGGDYSPTQEWNYRRIAAGMDFPYEIMLKNWGGLSFAAGRLVLSGLRLDVKSRQKLLIERWLCPVWRRVVTEGVILGAIECDPIAFSANVFQFTRHTWTPQRWLYSITPGEEVKASILEVQNNFRTRADVVAEYNGDLEDVYEQRAFEREEEEALGILPPDEQPQAPDEQPQAPDEPEASELSEPKEAEEVDKALAGRAA